MALRGETHSYPEHYRLDQELLLAKLHEWVFAAQSHPGEAVLAHLPNTHFPVVFGRILGAVDAGDFEQYLQPSHHIVLSGPTFALSSDRVISDRPDPIAVGVIEAARFFEKPSGLRRAEDHAYEVVIGNEAIREWLGGRANCGLVTPADYYRLTRRAGIEPDLTEQIKGAVEERKFEALNQALEAAHDLRRLARRIYAEDSVGRRLTQAAFGDLSLRMQQFCSDSKTFAVRSGGNRGEYCRTRERLDQLLRELHELDMTDDDIGRAWLELLSLTAD